MASVRITCWRDIPLLVTARDGLGEASVPLSPGFQDLVDRVAVQEGLSESDAYLADWRVEEAGERPGPAAAVARMVADELEAELDALRARHLRAVGGLPGPPPRPDAGRRPGNSHPPASSM